MKYQKTLATVAIAATLTGCSNMTQDQRTAAGAVGGAIIGGVIGHQVNDKNGRYVGAILGALAGGAIGRYMDRQQQDLEQVLASSGITVSRIDEATIKLHLPDSITFAVDKSDLNPAVYPSLNAIANVVNQYKETAVHVLGFTDSTGSEQYNLDLSQRRAQAAGNYLASQGVVSGRIVARGYGEAYPVAGNDSAAGKAQNRRAEIYIRAIEQGNEQAAYAPIY